MWINFEYVVMILTLDECHGNIHKGGLEKNFLVTETFFHWARFRWNRHVKI